LFHVFFRGYNHLNYPPQKENYDEEMGKNILPPGTGPKRYPNF
jgi:hypothetical protein